MKPMAVATNSVRGSTTKRFGFGYERKSDNSPSSEIARAEFLFLVLEVNPEVVSRLFNTAHPHFSDLLTENEDLIVSLCDSLKSEIPKELYALRHPYIRRQAIERFLPNWHALQLRVDLDHLRAPIEDWAREHNLTASWCLDHAIDFLREFEGSEYKKWSYSLPNAYIVRDLVRRAWQSAIVNRHCHALGKQYQSNVEVEERGVFSFIFDYNGIHFELPGPFNKFVPTFKEEVEKCFVASSGSAVPGARKALSHRLTAYLEEVEAVTTELGLEEPPIRWAANGHFSWLIDYQITPCKTYREIGRNAGKDQKTVREGIKDVAKLIGLELRSAQADRFLGRPRGAKDKAPRRRIGRPKEKVRGNVD